MNKELPQRLVALRRNHAAWLLLASRNAPLTLACLQSLLENYPAGIPFDDAVEQLATLFGEYANDSDFETGDGESHHLAARKELRLWIRKGLVVERDGHVMATDSLQRSLGFLTSLEDRSMTSTASRLGTVQREIENLESQLNPDQENRIRSLKDKIAILENELALVEQGDFEVLAGARAEEGIREVYQLAISLRTDFRRVEDSYREADLNLRQKIIGEKRHRGEIVDELLSGNETLVNTAEGQVFEGFHRQLVQTAELERMKSRLRSILDNASADKALDRRQKRELRELVSHLLGESERVIQARARSEHDVRGFLSSGIAAEQLRVGALLQEIFRVALDVDWQSQAVRRQPSPLPPIAVAIPSLPLIERLRAKEALNSDESDLDLSNVEGDPSTIDEEFWRAYRALDRTELFEDTIEQLKQSGKALTLGELAKALPPTHDLETLAYWLAMAREAGIEIGEDEEVFDLTDEQGCTTRFHTPKIDLEHQSVATLKPEELE